MVGSRRSAVVGFSWLTGGWHILHAWVLCKLVRFLEVLPILPPLFVIMFCQEHHVVGLQLLERVVLRRGRKLGSR